MANTEPPRGPEQHTDVNARALVRFGVYFSLGIALSLLLVWGLFRYFQSQEPLTAVRPSQAIGADARRLPPEPRLQATPVEDLNQMLAAENEIMHRYAWLDRSRGTVRIPIDRAMDLLAREGLPARQASPAQANQATVPVESGLGPVMTQSGGPLSPNRVFPPDQPLEIRGSGDPKSGRQAGGPPTPPERSLAKEP